MTCYLRVNDLPADVRLILTESLQQVQYFISPYGASQLINIIKSTSQQPSGKYLD